MVEHSPALGSPVQLADEEVQEVFGVDDFEDEGDAVTSSPTQQTLEVDVSVVDYLHGKQLGDKSPTPADSSAFARRLLPRASITAPSFSSQSAKTPSPPGAREILGALEHSARRYYLALLSDMLPENVMKDVLVRKGHAFSQGFRNEMRTKVINLKKTWKIRAIKNAEKWFDGYLKLLEEDGILDKLKNEGLDLQECRDAETIRSFLSARLQISWVCQVFDLALGCGTYSAQPCVVNLAEV